MSVRRRYLDVCPGEARGVVTLDGLPERLIIERESEPARARLGERRAGRVREIVRAAGFAYLDIGCEPMGVLNLSGQASTLTQGQSVEVQIVAEARADKGPSLRLIGPATGEPRLLTPGPSLEERLMAAASDAQVEGGEAAREAADLAEEAALDPICRLPGGLVLSVEPTRALVAVDVDRGGFTGKALAANLEAIAHAARLLRLKGLGGTVAIDLIGFPKEGAALRAAATRAFAADQPGVSVLAPSRLGLLQIAKPWRERPIAETLIGPDGRPTARALAQRLVRALEREGQADPGARLVAVCAPEVAVALTPFAAKLGPRFEVAPEVGRDAQSPDIRRR
jgi:Ribonuclease G/E